MSDLQEALKHIPTPLLRQMAAFWGVPQVDEAGRPTLVREMTDRAGRPEAVQAVLAGLDAEEEEALRALLAAGGWMRAALFARDYGALRAPHLRPDDTADLHPTERLHRKGLLFRAFAAQDDWHGAVFYVPAELLPHLPEVPRSSPEDLLRALLSEQVFAVSADRSLHRDLAVLLALLKRERPLAAGHKDIPSALRPELAELLPSRFAGYARFCLHLARQARLYEKDVGGVLAPSAEGLQWLRAEPWPRLQVLFQSWRDLVTWDELTVLPALQVERPQPADLSAPRRRALEHLAGCSGGAWYELSSWLQFVEASDPLFLRASADSGGLRVHLRESGELLRGPQSWARVEGAWLHFLVQGPLHVLGLVDCGQHGDEDTFRLTAVGEALLRDRGRPELADEAIVLEGTFEAWVPPEASPYAAFVLESCAERVRWDRVMAYRLTRPALQQALQRGLQLEGILDLLEKEGRGELPQNVAYSLREWAAGYGRLRLYRALLLAAEDRALLEEVLGDPQVEAACGERLSGETVQVDATQMADLLGRLGELGHLPRVAEALSSPEAALSLSLTGEQAAVLLAVLWVGQRSAVEDEAVRALAPLVEQLRSHLSLEQQEWARRRGEEWEADTVDGGKDVDALER